MRFRKTLLAISILSLSLPAAAANVDVAEPIFRGDAAILKTANDIDDFEAALKKSTT